MAERGREVAFGCVDDLQDLEDLLWQSENSSLYSKSSLFFQSSAGEFFTFPLYNNW